MSEFSTQEERAAVRAAVLREAADGFDRHAEQILDGVGDKAVFVAKALRDQAAVWSEAAETLRRLADEAQQPAVGARQPDTETPGCPDDPTPEEWQERAKRAEAAVNRARAALNDCKARGATGMQYERAVAIALGDRKLVRHPGPLCHETDPVTLRECALPAHAEGDHEDGDHRWPAHIGPTSAASAVPGRSAATSKNEEQARG